MAALSKADVRVFLGKSGSGKTSLALDQLRAFKRVLIFDPNGEDQHARGAQVATTKAQLVNLISIPGPARITWRGFDGMDDEDAFEWGNRCAMAGEGFAVFWDEVDRFAVNGRLPPYARRMVNGGRHRGLAIFAAARRPLRVPRDLTAAATAINAFRFTEPADLDYMAGYVGRSHADQLPGLADHHFLAWTEQGAEIRPPIPL